MLTTSSFRGGPHTRSRPPRTSDCPPVTSAHRWLQYKKGGMLLASTLVGMLALASPADRITPRPLAVPAVTRVADRRLPERAVLGSGPAAADRLPPRPRRPRERQRGHAGLRARVRTPVDLRALPLSGAPAGLRQRRHPLHDPAAAPRADPADLARTRDGRAALRSAARAGRPGRRRGADGAARSRCGQRGG